MLNNNYFTLCNVVYNYGSIEHDSIKCYSKDKTVIQKILKKIKKEELENSVILITEDTEDSFEYTHTNSDRIYHYYISDETINIVDNDDLSDVEILSKIEGWFPDEPDVMAQIMSKMNTALEINEADPEASVSMAMDAIMSLLNKTGYTEVTEIFNKLKKYYS